MGDKTGVEYAESSWGAWRGCAPVSEGCVRCYARAEMIRYGHDPDVVTRAADRTFYAPLRWKEPRVVFVCPWSDFFVAGADAWRRDAWEIMREADQHFYLLLTKRPENIADRLPQGWPLPNVGLGVTGENQERWNERADELIKIETVLRFGSLEPLLERVDVAAPWSAVGGLPCPHKDGTGWARSFHWFIVGGESGPGARSCECDWVTDIIDAGAVAGVPVFVKQMGTAWARKNRTFGKGPASRGADPERWYPNLRVRQAPAILQPFFTKEERRGKGKDA